MVIAAGVLGLAALGGYAFTQLKERSQARSAAQQVVAQPRPEAPSIPALIARAEQARHALNTTTLSTVERELADATTRSTPAPKALEARRERLAVLGTLALEAAVRATALHDDEARQRADAYARQAQALAEQLEGRLEPGEARAIQARLAFVEGGDVLPSHPSVLLPGFRDRELRHAVLAQAAWSPGEDEGDQATGPRTDLLRELRNLPDPSGLEQALLALTLRAAGDDEAARAQVDALLATVPEQPLALGLRELLRQGAMVAVADGLPLSDSDGDPELELDPGSGPEPPAIDPPEPTPVEPHDPTPTSTPDPTPEPTPVEPHDPTPTSTPKPKPEPTPVEPHDPTPTSTPKPKPKPPANKRKTPEELTDEGCALVHSGNAQRGFSLLQQAFDLNPRDTKVTMCMAEGHMKLGRLPSARAMIERVLGKSPNNKKALLLAAKIENSLGNKRAATNYYRKVLELDPDNATAKSYVEQNG